jgi:hypothetical protein
MRVAMVITKLLLWLVVISIPLAGVWTASSMAALLNGPVWLTAAAGALLFPLGPLAWEGGAAWWKARRKRRNTSFFEDLQSSSRERRLRTSVLDRLLVRTLVLNLFFLGGLLWSSPQTASTALAARGDWMLDGVDTPWADSTRSLLHMVADRGGWLYETEDENPFATLGESADPGLAPPSALPPTAPTTQSMWFEVPEGAQLQIGRATPPTVVITTGEVAVPLDETIVLVDFADGSRVRCTLQPRADAAAKLLPGWSLQVDEGAPRPCAELQPADPTERPHIYLVWGLEVGADVSGREWFDGQKIAEPADVMSVKIRAPYLRVELTREAAARACEYTEQARGSELVLVQDDIVVYKLPVFEKLCTGVLSVPLTDDVAQRAGNDTVADLAAAGLSGDDSHWPLAPSPHPLAIDIPVEHAGSIQSVGAYIASQEPDPFLRVKALHDYVTTRVAYDVASLEDGHRAPQDADTVFQTHLGVCAGYANLLVALGKVADVEIVYLTGQSRDQTGEISGSYHAWNAARIEGAWYLIDATWNAGSVGTDGFTARYRTDYLFTPPAVFRLGHLPEHDAWQLAPVMSRGEYTRQPMLRPSFFAARLALLSPDRSQITVARQARFQIANPGGQHMLVSYEQDGRKHRCTVSGERTIEVTCDFSQPGTYEVGLFHNESQYGSFRSGGRILVNVSG